MQLAWIAFASVALPFFLAAQAVETPEQVALLRAKEKVLASLDAIPNYTCLQTIERIRLRAEGARQPDGSPPPIDALLELADSSETLQVEVGFVDDKELYSWPGEGSFEEKSLPEMVGFGFTSSGTFATVLRNAFLGSTEMFRPVGEEELKGRRVLRYNFRAQGAGRGLLLGDRKRYAEVPYEGSLWIDGVTFDVLRLRIQADGLSSLPGISEMWGQLDYVVTSIGNGSFLLPQSVHMLIRSRAGVENHERSLFSGCRLFGANSEISFGNAPSAAPASPSSQAQRLELPADATFRVKLRTPIDSEQSRVGDRIEGQLERAVKRGRRTLVPKGAIVTGRIRRLEHFRKPAHHVLGLDFTDLWFENRLTRIRATLRQVSVVPGQAGQDVSSIDPATGEIARFPARPKSVRILTDRNLPGVGMFRIEGRKFRIRRGFKTVWSVEVAE